MRSSFGKVFMGAAGTPTGASDDEFNRVNFLSHFEGVNNGVNNAFDDGSANNYTVTAAGNVTQGSFGPFARPDGEWGWSFDGDGDSLTFTNDATMSLDGDYTFELFFNARTIVIDTQHPNTWLSGTTQLFIHASDRYVGWYADGANIVKSADDSILTNVWNHVAVVRSGTGSNNTSLYLNGTRVAQTQNTATLGAGSGTARIGSYSASGGNFDGHISNIRILKGTALYSGSSITVPTSKLTAVTNTKLLTCQSNRFIDNSSTGFALTPVGDPAVSAFGPFLTSAVYDPAVNGASLASLANGDYLNCTVNSDFSFGTADFSIEYYTYRTGADGAIFGAHVGGQADGYYSYTSPPRLEVFSNGGSGGGISSNENTPNNSWFHVVISRQSGRLRIFIDGVLKNSTTTAYTINNDNRMFVVGGVTNGAGPYNGYITGFRVVNGSCAAAYQTSSTTNGAVIFTPPTAPVTAITNTKLLLNMADGQAIDSAAQSNLTLVGTAKTSTAQKLFGTASLLLDGNSDLVTLPADVGRLSASNAPIDFTIELAFRLAANVGGTPNSIIAPWETSGNQRSWMVRMDNVSSANKIKFFDSSTGSNNASTTFSTAFNSETWYKIALVSASGAVKLYVNGTADSTTHTWTTGTFKAPYDSTALLSIGANVPSNPDNFFNGNIDEVRLSKFARYTGNYTAQSEAFPDKGQ